MSALRIGQDATGSGYGYRAPKGYNNVPATNTFADLLKKSGLTEEDLRKTVNPQQTSDDAIQKAILARKEEKQALHDRLFARQTASRANGHVTFKDPVTGKFVSGTPAQAKKAAETLAQQAQKGFNFKNILCLPYYPEISKEKVAQIINPTKNSFNLPPIKPNQTGFQFKNILSLPYYPAEQTINTAASGSANLLSAPTINNAGSTASSAATIGNGTATIGNGTANTSKAAAQLPQVITNAAQNTSNAAAQAAAAQGANAATQGVNAAANATATTGAQGATKAGFFSKIGTSLKNGISSLGNFLKGKGGKIGLIALGITALVAGGAYLWNEYSNTNNNTPITMPVGAKKQTKETEEIDENEEAEETETVKEAENTEETDSTDETDKTEELTKDEKTEKSEKTEETQKTEPQEKAEKTEKTEEVEQPTKTEPKAGELTKDSEKYIVIKNDNIWNIAKRELQVKNADNPDYKVTNSEIAKRTAEIMELNNLHFEPDNYHVLIVPNQEIKLK